MEELNLVTLYWLVSIGLLVGYVLDLVMGHRGIGMIPNLAFGALGSVIVGVIMIVLGVFAPLIYAALGSIVFLFLVNIFSFEDKEPKEAGHA